MKCKETDKKRTREEETETVCEGQHRMIFLTVIVAASAAAAAAVVVEETVAAAVCVCVIS